MALPNNNITTAMVRDYIGENSNNVSNLCKSNNVWKYAKCKPVTQYYASREEASSAIQSNWYAGVSGNYRLTKASTTTLIGLFSTNFISPRLQDLTLGAPLRLGDFRGYTNEINYFIGKPYPAFLQWGSDENFRIGGIYGVTLNYTNLTMPNLINLVELLGYPSNQLYFGIAFAKLANLEGTSFGDVYAKTLTTSLAAPNISQFQTSFALTLSGSFFTEHYLGYMVVPFLSVGPYEYGVDNPNRFFPINFGAEDYKRRIYIQPASSAPNYRPPSITLGYSSATRSGNTITITGIYVRASQNMYNKLLRLKISSVRGIAEDLPDGTNPNYNTLVEGNVTPINPSDIYNLPSRCNTCSATTVMVNYNTMQVVTYNSNASRVRITVNVEIIDYNDNVMTTRATVLL